MTSKQFAQGVAAEKRALIKEFFTSGSEASVAQRINALDLTVAQRRALRVVLDEALTEMCYTLLLALDGEAGLGRLQQQEFRLWDQDGNLLTGGELEGAAWEVFHGSANR